MADRCLGVDIGSVSIKLALIEAGELRATDYRFHQGDIPGCLEAMLNSWSTEKAQVGITGSGARGFAPDLVVDEVVAATEGAKWITGRPFRSLLLIGGENIRFIELDGEGKYRRHDSNSDCASGTGAFIEQQAARLGLSLKEFERLARDYDGEPPTIATRCAVFARTDLIHRQQEGYSVASIAAGISDGVARAVVDAVIKGRRVEPPLLVAGGGSLHRRLLRTLSHLLGLEAEPVPHGEVIAAIGAALLSSSEIFLKDLLRLRTAREKKRGPMNPPLKLERSLLPDSGWLEKWEEDGVEINLFQQAKAGSDLPVYMGIDIGSTSTKLCLMSDDGRIILGLYTRTASAPVAATQRLFRLLERLEPDLKVRWRWRGVGTTGSGRALIGRLVRADLIINEITAHARAAAHFLPEVDTVIEIGGQDSKFIRLQNGAVVQSLMNTICAAGTGSFLEEQAMKLGVPLAAYADLVMGHGGPAISDRCTVYMERDLTRLQAEGWSKEELLASALHSVRDNYLARVVGQARVGENICFQGATARNPGLVAAFEVALRKPIIVSPYCHLAGAYGVSLLLREQRVEKTSFPGLGLGSSPLEQRIEICELCANHCRITVVRVGQEMAAWGFQCGREYEERRRRLSPREKEKKAREANRELKSSLPPVSFAPTKRPRIGLPLVLPLAEMEGLWKEFLARLGFEILLPRLREEHLARGKTMAQAEFCAPLYLAHGQVDDLIKAGADAIFFPIFIHGPEDRSSSELPGFYCYYTGYSPIILRHSPAGAQGRLISPVIDFRWPLNKIASSLTAELKKIAPVKHREVSEAFREAWKDWEGEKKKRLEEGERLLNSLKKGEWAIVLLGRPYNIANPVLNQDIPEILASYGIPVLTQEMISGGEKSREGWEGDFLHWHYGKIIMQALRRVGEDPRLFPIFLTNFRCSPDSFIINYFRDYLERARKPYLILQLDGLNSDIGYRTRLEAALESFRHWKPSARKEGPRICFSSLRQDKVWIVPHVDDTASFLAAAALNRFGYEAVVAREDGPSIHAGLGLVGGGECVPTAALVGSLIRTIEKERIPPERAAAAIPTSLFTCNFPQIPVLIKLILEKMGLGEVEIFTTGLVGQSEPFGLSLTLLHAYSLADNIRRLVAKIRPYEKNKGETEACREKALAALAAAIRDRHDLSTTFSRIGRDFASIPVERNEERPLVVIIGDLYVIANPALNLEVEKMIEEAGGEVVPASLVDITHFSHLNRLEKAWSHGLWWELIKTGLLQLYVRLQDKRWRKRAAQVVGSIHPPIDFASLRAMRNRGIPPELDGETAINMAKIEYYRRHVQPDAFLHVNPLYCCPGVVTASLSRWLEDKFQVPVINLYYDGIHNPNDNLRPHLHYLQEAREKRRRTQRAAFRI